MTDLIAPSNIVGISEIAKMARRSNSNVANWSLLFSDFPKPIASLYCGRLWNKTQIQLWLSKHLARLDRWKKLYRGKNRRSKVPCN